jgi:hypothetical protein
MSAIVLFCAGVPCVYLSLSRLKHIAKHWDIKYCGRFDHSFSAISLSSLLDKIPFVIKYGRGVFSPATNKHKQSRLIFNRKFDCVVGYTRSGAPLYGITVVVDTANGEIITVYFENGRFFRAPYGSVEINGSLKKTTACLTSYASAYTKPKPAVTMRVLKQWAVEKGGDKHDAKKTGG